MKIYIASSFSLIERVENVVHQLELQGHTIDVKWWKRLELKRKFAPLSPQIFYSEPECKYAYKRDRKAIQECDALVFVAERSRSHTGANVEVGMADAFGKPVYSIGEIKNSAMYYPVIRCEHIHELLKNIRELATKEDRALGY